MRKIEFLWLLLIISLASCGTSENEEYYDAVREIIRHNLQNENIIVLPYHSCIACIEKVEDFIVNELSENHNSPTKTLVILTGYQSQKVLSVKFGNLLQKDFMYLDKNDTFYRLRNKMDYPILIKMFDAEVVDVQPIDFNFDFQSAFLEE